MELESKTHTKISEKAKIEAKYDFLGVGPRNRATGFFLTSPPASAKLLKNK
jgi:hypothetical protein